MNKEYFKIKHRSGVKSQLKPTWAGNTKGYAEVPFVGRKVH